MRFCPLMGLFCSESCRGEVRRGAGMDVKALCGVVEVYTVDACVGHSTLCAAPRSCRAIS